MIVEAPAWLPDNAFTPEAVGAVLSDVLAAWSAHWFPDLQMRVSDVDRRLGQSLIMEGAAPDICHAQGAISATLPGRGKRYMLEGAVGVDLGAHVPGPADHPLLDRFAHRIVMDLVERIDLLLRDQCQTGAVRRLSLGAGGAQSIILTVPAGALAVLIKARIRKSPATAPLADRLRAIADQRVDVEAVLGGVTLALADVRGLAVGDVLVLDRDVTQPVALRMAGRVDPIGIGALQNDGNRAAIILS